jgi:hypothetical protein
MPLAAPALLVCALAFLSRFQEPPPAPPALTTIGAQLLRARGAPRASAGRFTPLPAPIALRGLATALASDAAERDRLRAQLETDVAALNERLAELGWKNDAAAGVGFGLAALWRVHVGAELAPESTRALVAQVQVAFEAPELRELAWREKQRLLEHVLGLAVFAALREEAVGEQQEARDSARAFAGAVLAQILGRSPRELELGAEGLRERQAAKPARDTKLAPAAKLLAVATPAGWQRETRGAELMLSRSLPTENERGEPLALRVVLAGAGEQGSPTALLHAHYDRLLRPLIPADAVVDGVALREVSPEQLRRFVGNGLRCHLTGVSWLRRDTSHDLLGTSQELHLYLVESGGAWFPVVASFTGLGGPRKDGAGRESVDGKLRHIWMEELWAATRGEPSSEPLFDPLELVGSWQLGSTTTGLFYDHGRIGDVPGQAVVMSSEGLEVFADGSFRSTFIGGSGVGRVRFQRQEKRGSWSLERDEHGFFFVRTLEDGAIERVRWGGHTTRRDGRRALILLDVDAIPTLAQAWSSSRRYRLDAEEAPATQELAQWASRAEASSARHPAPQACGAPDVPQPGDDARAWSPSSADGSHEWLVVEFPRPVRATCVRIVQSCGPGAIVRVEALADDESTELFWRGRDERVYPAGESGVLDLRFPASATWVKRLRLYVEPARVPGWNQIDAVELRGFPCAKG